GGWAARYAPPQWAGSAPQMLRSSGRSSWSEPSSRSPQCRRLPFSRSSTPGPRVTTIMGLSTTGSGPVFYLPQIATGPMGTPAGQVTTHYGFANTTGTVIAQQTSGTGGQDFL